MASSGTKEFINIVLDKFKIRDYFRVIVSGDEVSVGKPAPETFLIAAEKLGLSPQQCIVLEDATNGIESAKAAGCKCIAIPYKKGLKQDLSKADLILDSLNEVNEENLNSVLGIDLI